MTDEKTGPAPAAARGPAAGRDALARLHDVFGRVEWIEMDRFWSARVWFGQNDYARITVITGDLVGRVISCVGKLAATHEGWARITDPAEAAAYLAGVLTEDSQNQAWLLVEELFTRCVSELHLSELSDEMHAAFALPGPKAPAEERLGFIRRLPVVLPARVLVGIAVQAGNLLTKSSKG